MDTSSLEKDIGYTFQDRSLIETALTHPSYGGDYHVPHYQRLEFLGDAVLELAVSRYLYFEMPKMDEGHLTRIRQALVREETLSSAAERIHLADYIRLSVGEERTGGRKKTSILCDVMEAVIAAVYLDSGFEEAMQVITNLLGEDLRKIRHGDRLDAKSDLQEKLQRNAKMPVYDFISQEGPAHAPVFTYSVSADGEELGRGSGSSKQNAQQEAAREALRRMGAKN